MTGITVIGAGIVSALGVGKKAQVTAFRKGCSGISSCPEVLQTSLQLPVGEIRLTNHSAAERLGLDGSRHLSRTALLGMMAAAEALEDAGLDRETLIRKKKEGNFRIGLVSSTSVGGMDLTEHFYKDFMQDPSAGRLRDVKMHDCSASTSAIAEYCGIDGYLTTISTACSSAANAILTGARLLRHHVLDCVVAGGTDALSAFTLNGFNSLMILDGNPCRPFDADRAGLNLGEGAGYLVLQNADTAEKQKISDKIPYCLLSGGANRNDAYHQTASSPEGDGAFLAMQAALEQAGIAPEELSCINAHGTGTMNNDASEGAAMRRLFGEKIPAFSSTKAFTGHTLAAAGGIEAVFSALAIRYGYLYPNLNFRTPMKGTGLIPQTDFVSGAEIRSVLSNSFGFGGNCSSLVFTALP